MESRKQVLLIGAMGGLGSESAKLFSNNGWHVYAADVQSEVFHLYGQADNVTPVHLDLTNDESIREAHHLISGHTTGLDAIIHMAGILTIGSLVELPDSELRKVLEINLHGVYRVNKQFLPLLLSRKGRIVVLSSEVGRQTAAPFNGIYSISKHALEAYSDALRRELAILGVRVIKIQPGPFKTGFTKNAGQLFVEAQKKSVYFKENLSRGITYLPKVYEKASDPVRVAKIILSAVECRNPKTAYLVKPDLPRAILEYLPVKWADSLILRMLS